MNASIRQFDPEADKMTVSYFVKTYLSLFNEKDSLKYLSFTGIPFSEEMVSNWLVQARQSGVEYYAAYDENGSISGILVVRCSSLEGFEIMAAAVDKNRRRTGVGKSLIDRALQSAIEKGFRAVETAVFADNAAMLSLVIKSGFKPYRIEYRKRFDGEDIVYLKRYMGGG